MKKLIIILFLGLISLSAKGQTLPFEKVASSDFSAVEVAMRNLAQAYLNHVTSENISLAPGEQFKFEILAGRYASAIETIEAIREGSNQNGNHPMFMPYELFSRARIKQLSSGQDFGEAYRAVFRDYLKNCEDTKAASVTVNFTTYDAVVQFTDAFTSRYEHAPKSALLLDEAVALLRSYFLYHVYALTEPVIFEETVRDENNRYLIREELITSPRDGAELSVITVRKRNTVPLPAILIFTIYAEDSNKNQAMIAASKGYVGVIATSRGKRQSKNTIEPYRHEYKDVYVVIDWISQQPWNNGTVGMYGGSYNGFSQWASMKEKVHPALKTIIPSVSAAPGIDVPMENNIFHNFPYKWIPYVTNNPYLDIAANFDRNRWNNLQNRWFETGAAYNKMDSIDGVPNPLFQEWVSHPTYDQYWQAMIPYKEDFAHIEIPILSTTGYYDDGQRGAMYYYTEHLKYKPDAPHYLLIGPYDHWGAQSASSATLRGYEIDPVASINIREGLAFEWFDYILKGRKKPALLKDKVNFQVMGKNQWEHVSTLSNMCNDSLVYFLSTGTADESHQLLSKANNNQEPLHLKIDLADRSTFHNADYYPWPIIKDSINLGDGLVFETSPFVSDLIMSGSFSGEFKITSNKKDFDFSVNIFERTPEGKYFHLTYYIGRASYAKSKEERALLTPNEETIITFSNTRMISKKMVKGSQLIAIVNGNKNPYAQINYGTGKVVSLESVEDAGAPLWLKIHPGSKINIPIWRED
ncbi:MAG TPA: CocE/NonD family hydrolase [Saprospiraceae bacterium]|nr:CocE/NonD family hydrolase [Saprospiraceae bacterium]